MSRSGLGRRFLSFGSLPFLASIAPLFVLPAVARAVEPEVWASLLTAQAIGSVAGVLILSGWAIHGQARVAVAGSDEKTRRGYYSASLRSRALSALFVMPVAAVVSVSFLSTREPGLAALMLVATAWSGFSMNWYAVGYGRASWVVAYDFLPRISGNLAAIPIIVTTGCVWSYPVILIAVTTLGLFVFHVREFGTLLPRFPLNAESLERSERVRGAAVSVIGATYASAPLPIASAVGIAALPGLASADRLFRYALFSVHTMANALQEWVLSTRGPELHRRQITALQLHLGLGLVGAAGFVLLGPWAGRLLFGAGVAPTRSICVGYAMAFLFVSCSTPIVRNILVPAQRAGVVLVSVTVSAVVGLAGILIGAKAYGAAGVGLAAALTELVNLAMLSLRARPVVTAGAKKPNDVAAAATGPKR